MQPFTSMVKSKTGVEQEPSHGRLMCSTGDIEVFTGALQQYLEAFLCVVMVDKEHSCIVDEHVQWQVQLMVLVCKGLDGSATTPYAL